MNNIQQMISMLKQFKNPKEAVMNMVSNNSNPMIKNLVEMAQKGDSKGVEEFARNVFKEQGRDFDQEYSQFMNMFK